MLFLISLDSTLINISGTHPLIQSIRDINPRQISDNLYHMTSYIDLNIDAVTLMYNLELRDRAMNSGTSSETVSYIVIYY